MPSLLEAPNTVQKPLEFKIKGVRILVTPMPQVTYEVLKSQWPLLAFHEAHIGLDEFQVLF